jgi:thiamine biosynthesis protein ThiI
MKSLILHYQEIALKGKNRPWFITRLVHNLRAATRGTGVVEVRPLMGRIEIVLGPSAEWTTVRDRVSRVFGVANFARAGRTPLDIDAISEAILSDLGPDNPASFRVSVRRADKSFAMTSPEMEREIGGRIKLARGWRVDLGNPQLTVRIETLKTEAFYSFGNELGAGGLPTGVSGRVACLLSGGIDSPVAAWRMMRRGSRVVFIHFHSYPILSRASQEKARELAALLTRFQFRSTLLLVPFGAIQQRVILSVRPPLRVVIYRRLMMRIGEVLARMNRAQALITGDVVGQVASQTIENLTSINEVVTMPVLRPLIGMDKDEITLEAQRLGSYPISIIPDQDCCTLFTPRHPVTRAKKSDVETAEAGLDIGAMVSEAVAATAMEEFDYP